MKSHPRRIVFLPDSRQKALAGADTLANLIRPTLGPVPRTVMIENIAFREKAPEILDDGGTIARRVIRVADLSENVGAKLLRDMLWRLHEQVGDGTATAAVLFQAIAQASHKLVAAGVNPMDLRRQIERAADRACEALRSQTRPLGTQDAIRRCALTICHDPELADLLGEIFDNTGGDGFVRVREWQQRGLEREYVEGSFWSGTWVSRYMTTDTGRQEAVLDDPAVLASDFSLTTPEDVTPVMEAAVSAGKKSLFMVVKELSESALSVVVANQQAGTLKTLAVKSDAFSEALNLPQDLGYLTGARPLLEAAGDSPRRVTAADLGTARRAWATTTDFGVARGGGDPRALREHILVLREQLRATTDREEVNLVRKRLSRLLGGIVTLYVGGTTEAETKHRVAMAKRAVTVLHLAMEGGVVPGGGSGLVRCAQSLRAQSLQETVGGPDLGVRVVSKALEEPLRVIATNAGYEPSPAVAAVRAAPAGWGFDAMAGEVVDLLDAGIVDPSAVLEAAIWTAARSAALLLTTDVLVHPPDHG